MQKSTKLTIIFIFLSLFVVMVYRYYDYVFDKNFVLMMNTKCDPSRELCFSTDDPSLDFDKGPYKKIEILAKDAPACLEEHTCENFSCAGIKSCTETFCSSQNITEGEKCVNQ